MGILQLKPGREKSLLRRHPWIFSGAIARAQGERGEPESGETVQVLDARGAFLARGAYSPKSRIRARVWTWDEGEEIEAVFFRRRLQRALALRESIVDRQETDAYRLVNAESDGLPGLFVDRYGELLVMQVASSGPERWREAILEALAELTGLQQVYERSDLEVRDLEGLPKRTGALRGPEAAERLQIRENGLRFWVDVRSGQKSGLYLDQRANRARLRALASGRQVLDGFAYTGGFTLAALAGGAESVTAVESSGEALALLRENLVLNSLPEERVECLEEDVFQALRGMRDRGRRFDLIVLDPPKFAPTAAQVKGAARGYKDINLLAFKLLRPGGILMTFSCSGGVSEQLFQMIVAGAALDAGVEAQLLERLHQGPDHPVRLNFPEGAYLKGFVMRV